MAGSVGLLAGVAALSALSAALVVGAAALFVRPHAPRDAESDRMRSTEALLPPECEPKSVMDEPGAREGYAFATPTGQPSSLSCEQARRIVGQARAALAYEPGPITPSSLAVATADWLDPYGLWERVARLSHPGRARPSRAAALCAS